MLKQILGRICPSIRPAATDFYSSPCVICHTSVHFLKNSFLTAILPLKPPLKTHLDRFPLSDPVSGVCWIFSSEECHFQIPFICWRQFLGLPLLLLSSPRSMLWIRCGSNETLHCVDLWTHTHMFTQMWDFTIPVRYINTLVLTRPLSYMLSAWIDKEPVGMCGGVWL